MRHTCTQNTYGYPLVYVNDDCYAGDESLIGVVSGGFDGAGYYLIVAEEYMVYVVYCPYCGKRLEI